jgi:anti-anti-sigma regulatory factor
VSVPSSQLTARDACGVERWTVTTLRDRPRLLPVRTATVAYLVGRPAPHPLCDTRLPAEIVTTQTWEAGWLISLPGEIGPWDALLLDEELLDAADNDASTILVDLSDVTSLDRVATQILAEAAARIRESRGELFLATKDNSRLGYSIRPFTAEESDRLARRRRPSRKMRRTWEDQRELQEHAV